MTFNYYKGKCTSRTLCNCYNESLPSQPCVRVIPPWPTFSWCHQYPSAFISHTWYPASSHRGVLVRRARTCTPDNHHYGNQGWWIQGWCVIVMKRCAYTPTIIGRQAQHIVPAQRGIWLPLNTVSTYSRLKHPSEHVSSRKVQNLLWHQPFSSSIIFSPALSEIMLSCTRLA